MLHSGNRDRSRINPKIGCKQFLDRSKNRYAEFVFCMRRVRGVRIDRCDQSYSLAGRFQFAIDTKVIPAKRAATDYGNT